MSGFVHLHNHSEYSLLDAIARCTDIAQRLVELGYDTHALTDHGVMYGALEFYCTLRQAGLKPIIGCEAYVAPRKLTDRDPARDRALRHIVLLAKDETGYVNLMQLTSIAHRYGFYYKPRIDTQTLLEHKEGLIGLTACQKGVIADALHREGDVPAVQQLERYLRIFGEENLFIEVQHHGLKEEETFHDWAQQAATKMGLRLVATNDCHYVHKEDSRAHDIALCLRDKKLLTDTDRVKYSGPEYYIKGPDEMAQLFADCAEALDNTRIVAEMCNLELDLESVHFPRFTVPSTEVADLREWLVHDLKPTLENEVHLQRVTELSQEGEELASTPETQQVFDELLRKQTYEGAHRRYAEVTNDLRERIDYELAVITGRGFTSYFLICAEFCAYARSQDIPVGPGRGSAAGSVVAYCLEITDLDPLKYGLYFERFLNPERVELPDFDIDFCYRRRDEVIEHVKQKYGADRVALIVTYSRLKARAVIKAVGRTKGLEFQYVDRVTKEINGLDPSIDDAIHHSQTLRQMLDEDPVIAELIEDARRLEGIAAHHSVHAAGLVIAPDELSRFVPVQKHRDSDLLVTQYAMDTIPLTGLVKFDFLGLRNLTMIQDTVDYIREHEGVAVDPRRTPDDDLETFAMLQRGDSYGVFQFEAPQVKRMLLEAHPESVLDLTAINAANRPGPLQSGNTERYLLSRRDRSAPVGTYPSIAEILEPTGGVLLYQEQVMEIARKLAGFSLGEADLLRKAMGKKIMEVMEGQQGKFLDGARERGVSESEARSIWEMMAQFAGYGFNKAHSACYAWIAYQTAYLKAHYPQYFMCAMLNSFMGNSAKLAQILAQCRRMHIPVLPPSVNGGHFLFTPTVNGEIIFGLGGIKGIGGAAVKAIVDEREGRGRYESLAGFLRRTRGRGVNRKVLQALAMAGAFDCLETNRAELIRNLDEIEDFMRGPSKQEALFGNFEDGGVGAGVLPTREVTERDVALLEKRAIGLFLTNHPYATHPMYNDQRHLQLVQLQETISYDPAKWQDKALPRQGLVGLLTNIQIRIASTSSKPYAKGRLEDSERSVSVIVWPKAYDAAEEAVTENSPVVVWGRVQIPEVGEDPDEVWDRLEIVVDRVAAYELPDEAGNGPDPAEPGAGQRHHRDESGPSADTRGWPTSAELHAAQADPFSPLPITWEIDLAQADRVQLEQLARNLEQAQGSREVRMRLRDVSGQLRRIKVNRRFFTSLEVAEQLEREFPFIHPLR